MARRGLPRGSSNVAKDMVQVMIGAIIVAGAAIPVVVDSAASSGATGTTATVMGVVPVLLAMLLIVVIASRLREVTA